MNTGIHTALAKMPVLLLLLVVHWKWTDKIVAAYFIFLHENECERMHAYL